MSRQLVERVSEAPNPCAPDPVSAKELRDGTWLLRIAESNFQRFGDISDTSIFPTLRKMSWGSLCSGSEGTYFVMEAINAALAAANQEFRLEHRFSCEISPEKRCWIEAVAECGPATMQELLQLRSIDLESDGEDVKPTSEAQEKFQRNPADSDSSDTLEDYPTNLAGCKPGEAKLRATLDSSEMPCRFCDITDMGSRMSKCMAHGDKCFVPHVDLLVVGTSCKDLSKANPNKSKNKNVLQQSTSRGGSAQTFRGLLAYLDAQRPAVVCYENVDALVEDSCSLSGSSNMEVLMNEFATRGYQVQATICEASKFGLPSRRRRLYAVFVQMTANSVVDLAKRPVSDCFSRLRQFLSTCMRESPSLETVLLPHDDDAVLAQLAARRNRAEEPMSSVGQAEWPEAHMKFAQSLQIMWAQPAGEHLQNNPWYHTLGNREKNALPLLQAQMPQRLAMVRDLSQSIGRANCATWQDDLRRHVCPTLLSKMTLWLESSTDSSKARIMLGREALCLQGFPIYAFLEILQSSRQDKQQQQGSQTGFVAVAPSDVRKTPNQESTKIDKAAAAGSFDRPQAGFPSEGLMADLAGNAMALPVVMAVVQSMLACLEWRDTEIAAPVSQVEDVDTACAAVALLQSSAVAAEPEGHASRGSFKRLRRG